VGDEEERPSGSNPLKKFRQDSKSSWGTGKPKRTERKKEGELRTKKMSPYKTIRGLGLVRKGPRKPCSHPVSLKSGHLQSYPTEGKSCARHGDG